MGIYGGKDLFVDNDKKGELDSLDIGFSISGLLKYRMLLKENLILETRNKLENVSAIESALNTAWQGNSREKFKKQFEYTIGTVIQDIEDEYYDLDIRFDEIQSNYIQQDQDLMNS